MAGVAPDAWRVDPAVAGAREVGAGIWRLRIPLPWPGNDHVNAYALDGEGGGIVLVDCGTAGHPTNVAALDVALAAAGRRVEDVELLVGTHAHSDHVGLAAHVIARAGCPFWAHPATGPLNDAHRDPGTARERRMALARIEGVPAGLLPFCGDTREETEGVLRAVEPDVVLAAGSVVPTAVGDWRVVPTPGHAPSQVCLVQDDRRVAVVADLVCAAFAPWFDIGYSPDPYAEWQDSLARVSADGPVALALPGHGRPVPDLAALLRGHRDGLRERLDAVASAVRASPGGAWDVTARALATPADPGAAVWAFDEGIAYLRHLRVAGHVERELVGDLAVHHWA